MDVFGPVTDSGHCYVLLGVDYFTKWPEAYVVPDQSAVTTAGKVVEEMFTHFRVPAELHSDQGTFSARFVSSWGCIGLELLCSPLRAIG